MIAFALENFFEGLKDYTRFVQWVAKYAYVQSDGIYKEVLYPMHKCTDEEMAKFYPPSEDSRA